MEELAKNNPGKNEAELLNILNQGETINMLTFYKEMSEVSLDVFK